MKLIKALTLFSGLVLFPLISNSQKIFQMATDGESLIGNTGKSFVLISENGSKFTEITTTSTFHYENIMLDIFKNTIVGSSFNHCLISTDKGLNWKLIKTPEKEPKIHSMNLIESTIFVGANSSLYLSNDNGETWEKASGIKKAEIHSIAKSGTTLYAGGKESENPVPLFYISTDNGKNWEKFNKDLEGGDVSHITTNDNTVLIATVDYVSSDNFGVYSLNKDLKKWELLADKKLFKNTQITGIAISDTNYVISGEEGYYTSNDKGKSWNKVNIKVPNPDFQYGKELLSTIPDPNTKTGTLYSLNYKGHLFLSKDNGANWEKSGWQSAQEKEMEDAILAEKAKKEAEIANYKLQSESLATAKIQIESNNKILIKYFRGIAEISYSNYDSAIVNLNKAIAIKPDFKEAYQARIKCYQELKQIENAKNDSITLASIKTDENKENLFYQHFKLAETEVNNVSSEWHTDCYYKDAYGWYMRAKKSYSSDDQLKFLWKATELDATKAEYWILLGDISRDNNYPVAADTHYNRAMKVNPNCEWYDYDLTRMVTCGNCNGKGYRLQVNITQQKVNNTTHSTSDSEKKPCTECFQGYVKVVEKFPSVRLVK